MEPRYGETHPPSFARATNAPSNPRHNGGSGFLLDLCERANRAGQWLAAARVERLDRYAPQSTGPSLMKRTSSISFLVKSGELALSSICERRCSLTALAVKSRRKCLMPFMR
jgi:hypothetical protein